MGPIELTPVRCVVCDTILGKVNLRQVITKVEYWTTDGNIGAVTLWFGNKKIAVIKCAKCVPERVLTDKEVYS